MERITYSHIEDESCKHLWAAVVHRALIDATMDHKWKGDERKAKRESDFWLSFNGRSFREVCGLAGIDPDALHELYTSGMLTKDRVAKSFGTGKQD